MFYIPIKATINGQEYDNLFEEAEKLFKTNQIIAVCGMPGLGKSRFAKEYLKKHKGQSKQNGEWFKADTAAAIALAFRDFVKLFDISTEGATDDILRKRIAFKLKSDPSEWLFVFDNVENPVIIREYTEIFPANVKFLLTTRDLIHYKNNHVTVELFAFGVEQTKSFLKKALTSKVLDDAIFDQLAIALSSDKGCLPKELELAAGYFNVAKPEISQFLKNVKDFAFTPLVEVLLEKSPEGWTFLQYLIFLDPDFIPIELLRKIYSPPSFSSQSIEETINILERLSLIEDTLNKENVRGIKLHRLVQDRALISSKRNVEYEVAQKTLIEIVEGLFPQCPKENLAKANLYISHVLKLIEKKLPKSMHKAKLIDKLAHYDNSVNCDYNKALAHRQQALEIMEEFYPNLDHSGIVEIVGSIGYDLWCLGKFNESITQHKKQLLLAEKFYNTKRSSLAAKSLNSIGLSLWSQAKFGDHIKLNLCEEALKYCYDAAKMRYFLYQQPHPDIADSLNDIGRIYHDTGEQEKALIFHRKAYEMRCALYPGVNHVSIASSLNNKADVLSVIGRYDEALKCYQESYLMLKDLYPNLNHPFIGWTVFGMAGVYRSQKKNGEALALLIPATTRAIQILGIDHPWIKEAKKALLSIDSNFNFKVLEEESQKENLDKSFLNSIFSTIKLREKPRSQEMTKEKIPQAEDDIPENVKKESLKLAEEEKKIGPRQIPGIRLQDVDGRGNCFYLAVIDQMKQIHHGFLNDVKEETEPHTLLRLRVQGGEDFKDREWANDSQIEEFVRKFDIVLLVIDTRNPGAGFVGYFYDANSKQVITCHPEANNIPLPRDKPVIRLAATGNHFLSVRDISASFPGDMR